MSTRGACHCRSVRLFLDEAPHEVVACDCSLCSRRGMLWAISPEANSTVDGNTEGYSWGDEHISFHHCPKCGCTTHWQSLSGSHKMGVNVRLLDGFSESTDQGNSSYSFGEQPLDLVTLRGANG